MSRRDEPGSQRMPEVQLPEGFEPPSAAVGPQPPDRGLTILGETVRAPIDGHDLERIPVAPGVTTVTFSSEEGTSLCPITQQPDHWTVDLTITPGGWSLESKSLKLYLWSFRQLGIFAEEIADTIAEAVYRCVEAHHVSATIYHRPRGGIAITVTAERGVE